MLYVYVTLCESESKREIDLERIFSIAWSLLLQLSSDKVLD